MKGFRLIFEWQWLHALLLAILLAGAAPAARLEGMRFGELWGIATPVWFWCAVGFAVAHQVYVWFCWRIQLHGSWLTRGFGGSAFHLYAVGFSILGILRVAAVFLVAISNRGTLPGSGPAMKALAVAVLLPSVYLFYSVLRYFSARRAFGIDHFDETWRSKPFERRGIFRWTRNGMYAYGFFLLWAAALWWASCAALLAAAFNHFYIWVHYIATERPDMRRIYGEQRFGPAVERAQ